MYRPFRVNKNIVAIIALSLTSIVMILALGYYEIHVLGNYEVALKCLNRLDDKQSLVEEITNDSQHILQRLMEDNPFDADEISEIKSRDLKITLNMVTLSKSNKTEAEEEAYKALDEAIKDLGTALMPMLLRNDHEALSIEGYHLILRNIMRSVHRYEKILDAQVDTVHNQIAAYFPVAHGNIGFTTLGISFLMLILTAIAIFYTRRYNFKIYDMAHRDKDSGLFTRQYFNEVVDDILAKSSDLRGYALIDIATINEVDGTLGAEVGDQLIADIGSRLSQTELGHEISGRLGGCVFIFLTKPFNSIEALNSDLERIFTLLKQPFVIKGYNISIDLNIGVSIYPMNHLKATALEQMAGNVLHLSKKTGLNRIDYYDDNIKDSITSNIEMSFKLSKALKDGDFYVEYQAIKHRHDSQIVVYEALIRWLDDGVVIPPMSFIPLAERNGQIISIGMFVIEQVCLMLLTCEKDVAIAINISPIQLQSQSFYADVLSCIERYEVNANQLIFEITENLFVNNFEEANKLLAKFRAIGIKIALDDFGTGYSSLSYLKNMAVDILKIDKMFIASLDDESHTIVGEIVNIAHKLDLKVVAEGVETDAHYETLRKLNVDYFQGYLIGKPGPMNEDVESIV